MKPVEPILTVELFPPLSRELLTVLRNLSPADWAAPTVCTPWSVKDVAAHLLDGNLGGAGHDSAASSPSSARPTSYDELVTRINQENDEWVRVARRISPDLLIELLKLTDRLRYEHFRALKGDKPARTAVAWAGDHQSPNWFHIAREYTEKWLHQQHIREAVGQPLLLARRWLHPVLDTFLRGLPHTYRSVAAEDGVIVSFRIVGEAGGDWSLLRQGGAWHLFTGIDAGAVCLVQMDQDLAWRLFSKGASREAARLHIQIEGDQAIGAKILDMVSIMA